MKFSTLSKAGFAASLCAALTGWSTGVQAGTLQDTIFAKVEPSVRDRMFFRLSYVHANVKTTSKDAYDVTGPVLALTDFRDYLYVNGFVSDYQSNAVPFPEEVGQSFENYYDPDDITLAGSLRSSMNTEFSRSGCQALKVGLGTPCGIKAKSAVKVSTVALSVGYFIDDQYKWAVEALLLGAPINATVYGDGANQLNGKAIIKTKMLPPIVTLGYHFGAANSVFRPYLGVGASYAIFFNTKATEALNVYQGGGSAGDTSVSIKNSYAVGPFVGLNFNPKDFGWTFGLNVGKLRFKTEAVLVTQNTRISSDSQVIRDYGATLSSFLVTGAERIYDQTDPNKAVTLKSTGQAVSVTTALMCDLARAKYGNNDCNHGTFTRKADTILDSTLFMFNASRSF